ncbi:MAG: TIM barrel protein [Anaerolineales bacterium]|jgi:deoxyribonuclease-4
MAKHSFRFGTVGSPISTPKKPGGSVGAVLRLKELGFSAFEIGWVRSVRVSEKTCAEIKSTAAEQDVAISVHAPYYINMNADEEEWPKSRQRLMDAAHYGHLAGATDIVFHPGSYFGNDPQEVMPRVLKRLQGCVKELRDAGNTVFLCPETMGKGAMIGSVEDVLQMSRELEGVKPCLDFAHLHARPGDGSMNSYDEWARVLEAYGKALGDDALKELHIHMSGIEYTEGGEKEHLPVLESDLDLNAIFTALKDFKAGGRMVCESPAMEDDAQILKDKWLEISGEG